MAHANKCYDSDCNDDECYTPEHFNFICFDPSCEKEHCEIEAHYRKTLLGDDLYQDTYEAPDMEAASERLKNSSGDVKVKLCDCDDCADDDDCDDDSCSCHDHHHDHDHEHEHHMSHGHEHEHEHGHEHEHDHDHGDSCSCGHDHEHEHEHEHEHDHDHGDSCSCGHDHEHEHEHEHDHGDSCGCGHDHSHDAVGSVKLCDCDDCADDDDDDGDVIAEGKPLLANRGVQIIVSAAILLAIGYAIEFFGGASETAYYAKFIVLLIGTVIAGYDIVLGGVKALVYRHKVTTSFLIGLAAICSLIIGHPEEAAVVTLLYFLSEFLEDYAEQRAQHSIKALVEIAPETAVVKVDGREEIRPVEDVHVNDIVIIKPGDKVPIDGNVVKGTSSINQASITGESVPVNKEVGDQVFAGTVNEDGYLEIGVTKESYDTVISRIVDLVARSQLNKSNTETFVDKFSSIYTPAIIIGAVLVALVPPIFFGQDLVSWVYRALCIMVVSCPCAFVISTPVAMVSAITSATRKGVLIKGSSYIEEMRNIHTVIFDKTGTLTEGKLNVSDFVVLDDNYTKDQVLDIASSLEDKSSHPIAVAIKSYAEENGVSPKEVESFKNVPGKGIVGFIDGKQYYAANESLIEGSKFDITRGQVNQYASSGKTVVFIGDENSVIALITVVDKIRDEATRVISKLKDKGIKTVMLTGDNKVAAQTVGEELGVSYVYSDLLPEDKLNILDAIRNKFGDVAMVGDGINDAPALSRANVGIAMGAVGSDVAIETADVALMQDDLTKLPYLVDLSYRTMGVVKQNVFSAAGIKSIFAILAVFNMITLMAAVGFGDMGLTLLVILNSLRIGMVKSEIN